MLTSDVARGIPQTPTWKRIAASTAFSTRFPSATQVGIHGDCRLKKERLSMSIVPLNVSPSAKAASAPATTGVCSAVNSPRW